MQAVAEVAEMVAVAAKGVVTTEVGGWEVGAMEVEEMVMVVVVMEMVEAVTEMVAVATEVAVMGVDQREAGPVEQQEVAEGSWPLPQESSRIIGRCHLCLQHSDFEMEKECLLCLWLSAAQPG